MPITEQMRKEHRAFRDITKLVTTWLQNNDKTASDQCQQALAKLLQDTNHSTEVDFAAAKVAWLAGDSTNAIAILSDVARKHPDEKGPELNWPVAVAARMWIGSIARWQGDAKTAQRVYGEIKERVQGTTLEPTLGSICELYLAEIESQILQRKDLAIARLKAVSPMKVLGRKGMPAQERMYKDWATHRHAVLAGDMESAQKSLNPNPTKTQTFDFLVVSQTILAGITAEPRIGFNEIPNLHERSLKLALECKTSPIDKSLALASLGTLYSSQKEWAKAEDCYTRLFNSDSFFAPEGGLKLAQCRKAQGKLTEAEADLNEVVKRFPGYSEFVQKLRQK